MMDTKFQWILNRNLHSMYFIQESATLLNQCYSFDDLKPVIDIIRRFRIVEDFDSVISFLDEGEINVSFTHVAYLISEILSRVVYGQLDYRYDTHCDDFIYLFKCGRLRLIFGNSYFNIERKEMDNNGELLRTYNRMLLLNII